MNVQWLLLLLVGSGQNSVLRDDPANTYEYAIEKIEELNVTLSKKLEEALASLDNDTDNAVLLMTITMKNGRARIQEVYEGLVEKLETIKASAEEEGIVTQCLDENQDQLTDLPSKMIGDVEECATVKANEVLEEIYSIISDVESIPDLLSNLEVEVENCGADTGSLVCVAPILQEILKDVDVLPQKVDQATLAGEEVVRTLVDALRVCVQKRVTQTSTNGEAVLENIVDCING